MRHIAWIDGMVVEASQLRLDAPFVMQRIHTLGGRVYNAYPHVAILRDASEYMFGFMSLVTGADVERIVSRLLGCAHAPVECSVPVAMRLSSTGVLSFEIETPTFGSGVYLRAKRPAAIEIEHSMPIPIMAESSESIAADRMTDRRVLHFGGDVALWVDDNGNLISRPWAPIFVYHNSVVYTPAELTSVEYTLAMRAIRKCGYELRVQPIHGSMLTLIDELFIVDIMGVSSVSSVRQHRLRSSVAIKIAKMMEP